MATKKQPKRDKQGQFAKREERGGQRPAAFDRERDEREDLRDMYRGRAEREAKEQIKFASEDYHYDAYDRFAVRDPDRPPRNPAPGITHEFTSDLLDPRVPGGVNSTPAGRIVQGELGNEYYFAPFQDTTHSTRWIKVDNAVEWRRKLTHWENDEYRDVTQGRPETKTSHLAVERRQQETDRVRIQRQMSERITAVRLKNREVVTLARSASKEEKAGKMNEVRQVGKAKRAANAMRDLRRTSTQYSTTNPPGMKMTPVQQEAAEYLAESGFAWESRTKSGADLYRHWSGSGSVHIHPTGEMKVFGEGGHGLKEEWDNGPQQEFEKPKPLVVKKKW